MGCGYVAEALAQRVSPTSFFFPTCVIRETNWLMGSGNSRDQHQGFVCLTEVEGVCVGGWGEGGLSFNYLLMF